MSHLRSLVSVGRGPALAGVLAVLILSASSVAAGVTITLGGGGGVVAPGERQTLSPAGSLTATDRGLLRTTAMRVPYRDGRWGVGVPLFFSLSDGQMDARVAVWRRMVITSIEEMLRSPSPRVRRQGLVLRNSYNRNQIKVDLTDECRDSTTEAFEGTPDPVSDEITLSIRLFLQRGPGNAEFLLRTVAPDFAEAGMIRLHAALLHESRHVLQDFRPVTVPGEHAAWVAARVQEKIYANEVVATALQLEVLDEVVAALEALRAGGTPTGGSSLVRRVVADLESAFAGGPALVAACEAVLGELAPHAAVVRFRLEERTALRELHQAFLDNEFGSTAWPAVGNFQDAVRRIRWSFVRREGTAGSVLISARGASLAAGGTVVPGNVLQQEGPGGVIEFAVAGVDFISNLMVTGNGSQLLVLGGEEATGDGVLFGFEDTDGDGVFEQGTQVEALRSYELFLAALARDFAANQIVALGLDTKDIVELATSGAAAHPHPDVTNHRGAIGYDREDLRALKVSADGLHAFAAPDFSVATWGSSKWMHAATTAVGGEFIPDGPWCPTEHHVRTPIFSVVPGGGYSFLMVRIFPGSTMCITIIFGPEKQVIAKQIVFTPGSTRISFGAVLYPGYVVQIDDMTNGISSVEQTVWGAVTPVLTPPVRENGGEFLDLFAMPETDYTMKDGTDLANWNPLGIVHTDGYGMAFFETPQAAPGGRRFFQAGEYVP